MKFSVQIPDDVFWMISRRAELAGLTVPRYVAQVSARLAAFDAPKPGDPLALLASELKAAKDSGWKPPRGSLATKRAPKLNFTDQQMESVLAAMEGTTKQ